MLNIGILVIVLFILAGLLLLKKKAIKEYEAKEISFNVFCLDVMRKTITENNFSEMYEDRFLIVNIDDKENYLIFGQYVKDILLLDFFMQNHNKISGRSILIKYHKIQIYGGGKIYYDPDKKFLAFYDGSDDFGFYEKKKIEKFQNEIKEIFSVKTIDYSTDCHYNYEKALSKS
jgi:hypothetical protein